MIKHFVGNDYEIRGGYSSYILDVKKFTPISSSRIKIELITPEPKDVEALASVERSATFKDRMDK